MSSRQRLRVNSCVRFAICLPQRSELFASIKAETDVRPWQLTAVPDCLGLSSSDATNTLPRTKHAPFAGAEAATEEGRRLRVPAGRQQ